MAVANGKEEEYTRKALATILQLDDIVKLKIKIFLKFTLCQ
jgi:hypothetical protein